MYVYWNKRKCLRKKRVQLPQECFGTPTWPPFHCFGKPLAGCCEKLSILNLTQRDTACEQALLGALAAGREKQGGLATTSLEFEFLLQFPCGSPSTELSDFLQSVRSGNERECKQTLKTRVKGNEDITIVISGISISHFLFQGCPPSGGSTI